MPGHPFSYRGASEVAFPQWLKVLAPPDWIVAGLWASLFLLTRQAMPLVSIMAALLSFLSAYRLLTFLPRIHVPPMRPAEI